MHNPWMVWATHIIEETQPLIKEQLSHNQSVIHKMDNMIKELIPKAPPPGNNHS